MIRRSLLLLMLAAAALAQSRHVVLISIDGGAAYHVNNPEILLPNIRQLIASGAWADGGSETVFPSVTHPSHTTLITGVYPGKHGVLANEMVRGPQGDSVPGNSQLRSEIILTRTIFDTARQKGLSTAAFMWPETVGDNSIDYNLITRVAAEGGGRQLVRNAFTAELEKDGIPVGMFDRFRAEGNWGGMPDSLVAMAACDAIRKHKPALTAIHLVETDGAQHTYGPASEIAHAEFFRVDALIGRIIQATKDAGIYDQTTFIVGADHGFATIRHEINVRPYFAAAGIADKIRFYSGRWCPFLRLKPEFDAKSDGPKLEKALREIGGNLHILRVYRSAEFPEALKIPRFEDSERVRGQVLLVADFDTQLVWTDDNDTSWRDVKKLEARARLPAFPGGNVSYVGALRRRHSQRRQDRTREECRRGPHHHRTARPARARIRRPCLETGAPPVTPPRTSSGPMRRVAVIGSPGAGKSTLSRKLAARTGLPLVHLDREYWRAGWVEMPKDEWNARVPDYCWRPPEWIIDGNYGGSLAVRVAAADTVVFLDLPRWRCLLGAFRRWVEWRGRTRDDMPPGCPERLDGEFFAFIWKWHRNSRARVLAVLAECHARVYTLRRRFGCGTLASDGYQGLSCDGRNS